MAGSIRRRRLIAAAVALAAIAGGVLLATGAFSSGSGKAGSKTAATAKAPAKAPPAPTATTAQPAAAPLAGTWQGTATQTATTRETYPADVRLAVTGTTVGKAAGTLSEKARGRTCKGDVKLVSRDASHVFRYDENPAKTG